MSCYPEHIIEHLARERARAEAGGGHTEVTREDAAPANGDPGSPVRGGAAPEGTAPKLAEVQAHVDGCVACRGLLEMYLEVHRELAGDSGGGRVLALREFGAIENVLEDKFSAEPMLKAAADTPRAGLSDMGDGEAITLITSDHYLVRIFPNQGRPGATAYLVSNLAEVTVTELMRTLTATLRTENGEYPFDEHGEAILPEYPVAAVELVLELRGES